MTRWHAAADHFVACTHLFVVVVVVGVLTTATRDLFHRQTTRTRRSKYNLVGDVSTGAIDGFLILGDR